MTKKYLYSREYKKEDSIIKVKGTVIGGKNIIVIAGPCAVEDKETIIKTAKAVKKSGAKSSTGY